ncbi:MAG: pyridine nucleotide-disulfide oxidoreductase [Gammaproteobacteria bacterium]|nr:FAD-dependent oxidoreductase [Gammaproteobacteria bacterium]MXY90059.1 pyridine nucleotide-disulfide oxidoreductase [Gammaproteobacteria bacterium]MYG96707.1 pyridine nucleotide-disulfide oxidoreductase [Gammaproteobacteria bacterium]
MKKLRYFIVLLIVIVIGLYFVFDLGRFVSLEYVQSQLGALQTFTRENFALTALIYFSVYVVMAAFSIPGALMMTLLGGALFGLLWGTLIVSFASSIGATLAFLIARTLLHDWVQNRYGDKLEPINRGMRKDGGFYLFTIRMVPLFPYFLVNLVMSLTPINLVTFYVATQSGMLLATAVFVNAGSELASITSLSGLVSGSVLFSFALVGVMPLLARFIVAGMQRRKLARKFGRPRKFDVNTVIIGAGSAGLVASLIVAGARAKVVLIERERMGGDCLYTGCVPSKSLLRSGHVKNLIDNASRFGIKDAQATVDFPAVMERIRNIIARIEPHDSPERFTSLGVECVSGEATIESPYVVRVNERRITTRSIILATGARPLVPPIPGLDQVNYLTSDSVWNLESLPERLLVVGGGPIGCELSQAFGNLGSRVTQVEMAPRILFREDPEVSELLAERFRDQGIKVLTGHKVVRFGRDENGDFMEAEHEGEFVRERFDRVLLALGRKPNVEGFGLEELEMPLTGGGAVEINQYLQTAYPNIYACGDVAGPYQFTHMASHQAWFAAMNALAGGWRKVSYKAVPWATFTSPEVARVGLSEQEARERGVEFEVSRHDLDLHDRALADGANTGFVKVLTVPGKDRILGAVIVGPHAGDLIGEFVLAMTHGMGLGKIAAATHIYPTMLEANKFAANAWRKAHMPEKVFPWMERYFRWQRG